MSREGTGVTYTLEPAQLLWKNRPWGGGGRDGRKKLLKQPRQEMTRVTAEEGMRFGQILHKS